MKTPKTYIFPRRQIFPLVAKNDIPERGAIGNWLDIGDDSVITVADGELIEKIKQEGKTASDKNPENRESILAETKRKIDEIRYENYLRFYGQMAGMRFGLDNALLSDIGGFVYSLITQQFNQIPRERKHIYKRDDKIYAIGLELSPAEFLAGAVGQLVRSNGMAIPHGRASKRYGVNELNRIMRNGVQTRASATFLLNDKFNMVTGSPVRILKHSRDGEIFYEVVLEILFWPIKESGDGLVADDKFLKFPIGFTAAVHYGYSLVQGKAKEEARTNKRVLPIRKFLFLIQTAMDLNIPGVKKADVIHEGRASKILTFSADIVKEFFPRQTRAGKIRKGEILDIIKDAQETAEGMRKIPGLDFGLSILAAFFDGDSLSVEI